MTLFITIKWHKCNARESAGSSENIGQALCKGRKEGEFKRIFGEADISAGPGQKAKS